MKKRKTLLIRYWLILLVVGSVVFPNVGHCELKIKYFGLSSGRLAFTYNQGGEKDIYILDFEKLTIQPLLASPAVEEYPTFSPDGKKIVFYSDVSGDREIYVIDSNGTNLTRLTNSKGFDEDPDWSPDGKRIVFSSDRQKKDTFNLYTMNADGSKVEALSNSKDKNTVPRWSPRGTEILYSTTTYWPGTDLMLYDFKAKAHKLLTTGMQSFCRANWNFEGSAYVFSYGTGNNINLWLQTKGEAPTEITSLPGREYDAVWDDDGKAIFFVGESAEESNDFQIYLLELDSKTVTQVTEGTGSIRYLSWSPLPSFPEPLKLEDLKEEELKESAAEEMPQDPHDDTTPKEENAK